MSEGPRRDQFATRSLIVIHTVNADGSVNGSWLQDHIGTLLEALVRADQTSEINSGLDIAVVEKVGGTTPMGSLVYNCRILAQGESS